MVEFRWQGTPVPIQDLADEEKILLLVPHQ